MTAVDTNAVVQLLTADDKEQTEAVEVGGFAGGGSGPDLADAIYMTGRPPRAAFVSFDKTFIRRVKRAGTSDVSLVPPAER